MCENISPPCMLVPSTGRRRRQPRSEPNLGTLLAAASPRRERRFSASARPAIPSSRAARPRSAPTSLMSSAAPRRTCRASPTPTRCSPVTVKPGAMRTWMPFHSPKDYVAGTKMSFPLEETSRRSRANVIDFLKANTANPPPLPAPAPKAAPARRERRTGGGSRCRTRRGTGSRTRRFQDAAGLGRRRRRREGVRQVQGLPQRREGRWPGSSPTWRPCRRRADRPPRGLPVFGRHYRQERREWTYEELDVYLTSPKTFAPGTKMTFPGLSKPEDRANVIAYLRTRDDSPPPLP